MGKAVKTKNYICIDLETTGLNPKADKIIEIGAVKVEAGRRTDVFETLVNPGRKLPEQIEELTGITDELLRDAPRIEEALPGLLAFAGEAPLLGHSVLFDYSFVKKAAVNAKLSFEREGIDTLKIARRYLPELESRSLDFLCGHYGIPHRAHRALADAEATSRLYDRLYDAFGQMEDADKIFAPARLLYRVKRDTPATPAQKKRLYGLLERHRLTVDYNVEQLTRSEASRYTDRILATYGR